MPHCPQRSLDRRSVVTVSAGWYSACRNDEWKCAMAEFRGRDLHLVKKALAIAVLAIERMPGPFQSVSDMTDMKALLDQLIESDVELEHYARAAYIAVTGEAPER